MGITGLLPFLKEAQREVNVSSFRGRRVAVDSYCWLHRGAYSCAMQLVMKSEKLENLPFIKYCMKRVNMLRQNDITPIMVFDGGYLPTKSKTEKDRRERRQGYLAKGKELLKEGKRSEAVDCFQKSVDVSHEMALALIKECRRIRVECIVAPYEADAQLAYLEKEGIVDLVITEDSDLLVFGCKRVLFKMDDSGNGKLIDLERDSLGKANKNLIGFTPDSFRQMCILSGCDYLSSVPGIGLGKATKLMRKYRQNPERVIRGLRLENSHVPQDYDVNFKKAEWTFLYQLVFDPRTQQQVRLNTLPDNVDTEELEFAGIELQSPREVVHMARGNIDPISHKVLDNYSPSKAPPPPVPKSQSWTGSAMGTTGRQYPLSIQAKLPLVSTAQSKGQFKPPKRTRPREEEIDGSMADEELRSLYNDHESSTSSSTNMSSGGWLSKRRKCDTSEVDLTSAPETTVISRYFSSAISREERAEQTPEGEASVVAMKAARKLNLKDTSMDPVPQERTEVSSLSSSSYSPSHKSLFRRSPPSLPAATAAVSDQVDIEITARKQLFPTGKGSDVLSSLSRFKFLSSKKSTPSKPGGQSPFELLDRSQKFVSENDSENTKKCFLLARNTEGDSVHPGGGSVLSDQKEDTPPSQVETGDSSDCSFSYMTSGDLIMAYPITLGEPGVDDNITSSQTSCANSDTEQPLSQSRSAATSLSDYTQTTNRRSSFLSSTNTSKAVLSRRGSRQKQIGLSRKSSKFNPPKPADSVLKQMKIGSYNYKRRPQM